MRGRERSHGWNPHGVNILLLMGNLLEYVNNVDERLGGNRLEQHDLQMVGLSHLNIEKRASVDKRFFNINRKCV